MKLVEVVVVNKTVLTERVIVGGMFIFVREVERKEVGAHNKK
jgi:hypothetical protein